ncbi:MAG: metallophosphoesterase [Candidatus Kerfeldbacteria bacterium]|nr:metallophosphoesterase [Candidatus Kerfeldbacteria bacterium]
MTHHRASALAAILIAVAGVTAVTAVIALWSIKPRPVSVGSVNQFGNSSAADITAVLVGAGDIASCVNHEDEATAQLLDDIDGTVFTLGDNVYANGTADEFNRCYHPTWGRHKARTKPAVGNHEYHTANATGYFGYFGEAAGNPRQGYYSYDVGGWHVVVLNSNCNEIGGCGPASAQVQWLKEDLRTHPTDCSLAYMHHPRFSSGQQHGSTPALDPIWRELVAGGVDVALAGHDHLYERFAPLDAEGQPSDLGIRAFTVGTGGRSHYNFGRVLPGSEARDNTSSGVLKLELQRTGYAWEFVPIDGAAFRDAGTGTCR